MKFEIERYADYNDLSFLTINIEGEDIPKVKDLKIL